MAHPVLGQTPLCFSFQLMQFLLLLFYFKFSLFITLGQQEYSSRQVGITFGIILGVLVPLILIGACIGFYFLKQRKIEDSSTSSWNYKAEEVPFKAAKVPVEEAPFTKTTAADRGFTPYRNSSNSERSDRSSSGASSLGGLKKRRMYDRSYRTNEPLPGRPSVDFEDVVEDDEAGATNISVQSDSDGAPSTLSGKDVYRHSKQTDIY